MNMDLLAATVKALDTGNPNGEFLVTLSAPTLDRDGEIVDPGAFNPLPDHISFDIDHGMSIATTVGSGRPYYDGDKLMVHGTFASTPLAQEVRTLINEGHIRTSSVAMMRPQKETKDDGVHITKAELLNGAFVPVPANRDAVIIASKALDTTALAKAVLDGLLKRAIAPHDTATTDAAWDNNTQKTNLSNDAGAATYRKAFAWIDDGADPDNKGSYRFIHHMVSSDGTVGAANMTACSTGIGVLNGGRGGTVIPDSGRKGVYAHLAKHLVDGGRKPDEVPPLKDVDDEEIEVKLGARNSASDRAALLRIHNDAASLLDLECQAGDSGSKHVSPAREDTQGADGAEQLELRARALRLLSLSMSPHEE